MTDIYSKRDMFVTQNDVIFYIFKLGAISPHCVECNRKLLKLYKILIEKLENTDVYIQYYFILLLIERYLSDSNQFI